MMRFAAHGHLLVVAPSLIIQLYHDVDESDVFLL
jgi:hypothetical protein